MHYYSVSAWEIQVWSTRVGPKLVQKIKHLCTFSLLPMSPPCHLCLLNYWCLEFFKIKSLALIMISEYNINTASYTIQRLLNLSAVPQGTRCFSLCEHLPPPHFSTSFYNHHPVCFTIDTGAETNMIDKSFPGKIPWHFEHEELPVFRASRWP